MGYDPESDNIGSFGYSRRIGRSCDEPVKAEYEAFKPRGIPGRQRTIKNDQERSAGRLSTTNIYNN